MNITKELINVVTKLSPALGAAIGGPGGALVGSLIAKLFGAPEDPQAIIDAIGKDSEAALKLKQLEIDLSKIDAQNYVTEVDDRKDARQLAIKNEWQTFILALGFLSFYAASIVLQGMAIINVQPEIQGSLNIAAAMIMGFYFGSSKGERNVNKR